MKKNCWLTSEWMKDLGLLLLRVTVGVIFIYHGWTKLGNMEPVVGMFTDLGFPIPAVFAYVIAIAELLGGIGAVLGIMTKVAGLGLAIIMLGALLVVHVGGGEFGPMAQATLALFGASMGMAAAGGGKWKAWSSKCPCS